MNDPLVDPLVHDWSMNAHKDGFGVRVVYEQTFRKLVANELSRLAAELFTVQQEMREEDGRTIRSSGLGVGIQKLSDREAQLRDEEL